MARTAVGYFAKREEADTAWKGLLGRGFSRDDITIIGRGANGAAKAGADEAHHVTAGEGAVTGGIFGLLLGAAAMFIPGIGPVVAVGPLAAALGGAVTGGVTGAVTGGIVGALEHAGVPAEEAHHHEARLKQGGYLLTVHAPDEQRYHEARQALSLHGADVRDDGGAALAAPPAGGAETGQPAAERVPAERVPDEGPRHLELRGEQLVPHKDLREIGEVRIRTEVEEVPARAEAAVLREQLRLQHVPVDQVVSDREAPWEEDGTYIIPVYEERLVLTKQLVLREYLRVERVPTTERQQFADTVRRERLVVEDPDHTGRVHEEYVAPTSIPRTDSL